LELTGTKKNISDSEHFLAIQQISMNKNPSKMIKEAVSTSFKRTFKFGIT